MNNAVADAPPDSGVTIDLIIYTTERRLKTNGISNDNAPWQYYCPLLIGTELNNDGVLTPVCYYGDNDISDNIVRYGSDPIVIAKPQGDPINAEMDYTFSINLRGTGDHDLNFQGAFKNREGEWDWRGSYIGRRAQLRGRSGSPMEKYAPDGRSTFQELLSSRPTSVEGTNPVQEEASSIFERLINASIPLDVQRALNLDILPLCKEEEKIRCLAPDFLPRAAVVTLFKQLHKTEYVDENQRSRIDTHRCDQFYPACIAYSKPINDVDPVAKFGWHRERDAGIIKKVQAQYGSVRLACYQLGYRRKVTHFHQFLNNPAYWYKRLSKYLVSSSHRTLFRMRASVGDPRLDSDIHNWCTRLALLKEAASDNIGGAPEIETVLQTLQGEALMALASQTKLDSLFIARLKKLFDQIENLKANSEEYIQLKKDLAMRQALAEAGTRRSLINFIQNYKLACSRIPTVGDIMKECFQGGCGTKPPDSNAPLVNSSRCLGLPAWGASIIGGFAMAFILYDLLTNREKLSCSEQLTMCISLVPTTITSIRDLAEGFGSCFSKISSNRLWKLLSAKCMPVLNWAGQSKIQMTVSYVLGVVVAGLCAWNALDRLQKVWKTGENIDQYGALCDFVLSALFFITTTCTAIAYTYGASATVIAFFGVLGTVITTVISSLIFAAIKWQQNKDPIALIITKYGRMYGLLKA